MFERRRPRKEPAAEQPQLTSLTARVDEIRARTSGLQREADGAREMFYESTPSDETVRAVVTLGEILIDFAHANADSRFIRACINAGLDPQAINTIMDEKTKLDKSADKTIDTP